MILKDGLFTGKRLRSCSDEARLYFPYYLVAANTLARLELDPPVLIARCFVEFRDKPTEDTIRAHFEEYESAGLCCIYRAEGSTWVQFDVPADCLPRHKTAADQRSPEPPQNFAKFRKPAQICESLRTDAHGVGVGVGVGNNPPNPPSRKGGRVRKSRRNGSRGVMENPPDVPMEWSPETIRERIEFHNKHGPDMGEQAQRDFREDLKQLSAREDEVGRICKQELCRTQSTHT